MSFVQKKIGTEQGFGADLRQLRELRGWTREALERATGIHQNTICLLEEGRIIELNDPAYAERHVRALVRALDGRVEFFLEKYRLVLKETEQQNVGAKNVTFIRRLNRGELFVPSKYLFLVLIFGLVSVLGWYVWHQVGALTAAPKLDILEPQDNAVVMESLVRVRGITDPAAAVIVNGQTAVVEASGEFNVSFDVPRGTTKLNIVSRHRYGGATELVRYLTYNPVTSTVQ